MYEREESEDILIEWDYPKPAKVMPHLYNRTDIWYKRLAPFKKVPGRRGRIERGIDSRKHCDDKRNNIKRSLRKHDPYQRWKIESAKEDDGTWSIWATFEGVMNQQEREQAERDAAERYRKMKINMRKGQLARQQEVARSTLSASLRPPTVR